MMGVIFLISVLIFASAILCQWALSARSRGEGWLFNWFPPYSLYYAMQQRKNHQVNFWLIFSSFLITLLTAGAWLVISTSTTAFSPISMEGPHWKALIKDNRIYLSKADALISNEEWIIDHKELKLPISQAPFRITNPVVLHSYQNIASKEFVVDEFSVDSISLSLEGKILTIRMLINEEPEVFVADLGNTQAQAVDVTKADVEQALKIVSPRLPQGVSFEVGPIRSISEKQSIAGIQIQQNGKLVRELTVTLDIRNNQVVLNHRSMMVLRDFISNYRVRNRAQSPINRVTLEDFYLKASQYVQKPITVIKRDDSEQSGLFLSADTKVLIIRQILGAGAVDVQIPITLIRSAKFSDLEVLVQSDAEAKESVYDDSIQERGVQGNETVADTDVNRSDRINQLAQEKSLEEKTQAITQTLVDDPYLKLINAIVVVTKTDGQKREGRLIKVTPKKSLTIQLVNGGIQVQVPQSDISDIEVIKKK